MWMLNKMMIMTESYSYLDGENKYYISIGFF